MLDPARVVPFLSHGDPLVRRLTRDYFHIGGDPGGVTADDVWAALDRLDGQDDRAADTLVEVPQTDASVGRLVDALAGRPSERLDAALQRAARGVEFPLLVRHRQALLACDGLDAKVRDHLARRLALADAAGDAAWDELMALGLASADQYVDALDRDAADALIEAAARHIDVAGPRALAVLDGGTQDWREVFAVEVVGHGRYAPATAALVGRVGADDDYLPDVAGRALARIGTDDVVDRLAAAGLAERSSLRLSHGEALGRIKRPASESALLRMIAGERDDDLRGFLLNNLSDQCSLAGLDAARLLIAADPKHPESIGLCERLVATAVVHGVTLPEEARWRERVAAHEKLVAARIATMDAGGLAAFAERMRARSPDFADPEIDDDRPAPPPLDIGGYDPYARFEPIRNAQPKVGRNDPCPCGSGKKYKRCHGGAA